MSQETSEEKKLPPSARTLRKAREKGQVPASREFVTAIVTTGAIIYVAIVWQVIHHKYASVFEIAVSGIGGSFDAQYKELLGVLVIDMTIIIAPLLALVLLLAVLANVLHKGGIPFSFDPVIPKFEKLNPVSGFKKMFNFRSMVELALALLKLALWLVVVAVLFWISLEELLNSPLCELVCVLSAGMSLFFKVLVAAIIFMLIAAMFDLPLQIALFKHEKKMTQTQMKQENKENQGNPEIKSKRKELHKELLENVGNTKSGAGKPLSPSFIVYGAGIAVALHFDAESKKIPFVVAKGKGGQANTIIESGTTLGIPLEPDADLAARIFRGSGVGAAVNENSFEAIVEVILKHNLG